MDGVLWRGDTPLPGFTEFFAALAERNIPFALATNNASKTPDQYVTKLGKLGLAVREEQIMTSAEATGQYLAGLYPAGTKVYVVGGDGSRGPRRAIPGITYLDRWDAFMDWLDAMKPAE